jgi:peptidyl-dipeptidase A
MKSPLKINVLLIMLISFGLISGCNTNKNEKMEKELREFISRLEAKAKPLMKEANLAAWNASVSGKDEDYTKSEQLQIKVSNLFANKEDFAELKRIRESNLVTDSLLNRQIIVLYNAYLDNQVDTVKLAEKIRLETEIEKKFSNFRADVDGKQLTDNGIEDVLRNSTSSVELQKVWEAHKKIGTVVSDDIIKLVKLRNAIARELGFSNYHEMSLKLSEQDPAEISSLFDELESLTRDSFIQLKDEIDTYLARRDNIKKENLMPWHYQNRFFQEAPAIYSVDLDKYYRDQDIKVLTDAYYNSLGLNIDDILDRSDLYEKPGKNQHAFTTNIDNEGDIRVLCNIKPDYYWMNTMLHEFGHGVYDKYIDRQLPFFLREPAHIFTTEAIANFFGRQASSPDWLRDMQLINDDEKNRIADESFKILRLEQLVFSRWSQVMYRFEKGLYENPDQDLNKLWWDLVEKYQMIKRPEGRNAPDWASKIHIATAPCYYHNYLLGELFASQLNHYITVNLLNTNDFRQSYFDNPVVGRYLIEKIFIPGSRWYWNDMIQKATGEKLTAKYYAEQFVR